MKLILREDVENLGKGGEVVDVKPGFGRNYLLPRGLAVVANPKNVRELEHQKKVAEAKAAKLKGAAEAVAFLQRRLARAGVEDELAKAGAKDGDDITIGPATFTFERTGAAGADEEEDE